MKVNEYEFKKFDKNNVMHVEVKMTLESKVRFYIASVFLKMAALALGCSININRADRLKFAKALADLAYNMTDEDIKKFTGLDGEEFNKLDVVIGESSYLAYPDRTRNTQGKTFKK